MSDYTTYHGYWFFSLRDNEIIRAKDLTEEYCILNCPQEYVGPFPTRFEAWEYKEAHPDESEKFHKTIKEMEEFLYGECCQTCSM